MQQPEHQQLFHYTCEHGFAQLGEDAILRPGADGFVWLTDLQWPIAKALGLTSHLLTCDRTEYRYLALESGDIAWWMLARKALPDEMVWPLELAEGAAPMHWYVTTQPVHVKYDPIRR